MRKEKGPQTLESGFVKRKVKGASNSKEATTKGDDGSDDDVAMSAHVPQEKRWGDIDL